MNPIWRGSSLQGKTFPVTFTSRIFRFCRCIRCWTRMNPIGRGNSSLLLHCRCRLGTVAKLGWVVGRARQWTPLGAGIHSGVGMLKVCENETHWTREFISTAKTKLHRCFHVWMNFWLVWLSELHWMRKFISTLALGWEARHSLQRMNPIGCGNSSRFMLLGHLKICSNRDSDHVFEFFCTMLTGCREWIPFLSLSRENESFDWRWNSSRTVD